MQYAPRKMGVATSNLFGVEHGGMAVTASRDSQEIDRKGPNHVKINLTTNLRVRG